MKNTFGTSVAVTLFGESHGAQIGAVIDGLAPGIAVDREYIAAALARRRPQDALSTARREADEFSIVSGVYEGRTTGTPLCILIPNRDTRSADYAAMQTVARPGHADYTSYCKYHGYADPRGGGHFSGRITAALVAAGAILQSALHQRGIDVATHILRCGDVWDRAFADDPATDTERLHSAVFPTLDSAAGDGIKAAILDAKSNLDSVGGILQTAVTGVPEGVGEPWFDTVEGILSHALFAIPAVKGVEFGSGFAMAGMTGHAANDPFAVVDGRVVTATNHNGGINGGITNGMPIVFQCAVKPTPSIGQTQHTVDFVKKEETDLTIAGRHDPSIVARACAVVDSVTALVIADLLAQRYGTDWLKG